MSAESTEDGEKVPESVITAFNNATPESDAPETLELDDSDHETVFSEAMNTNVGKIVHCPTYDSKAYYSVRHDTMHRMRIYKGYAIDDDILQDFKEKGVEKIFVGLKLERTVLEFDLQQYLDVEVFNKKFGDQRCPPRSDALKEWPNAVGSLLEDD